MSVNIFKNGILSKIAGAVGDAVPLINNFLTNQEGKGAADANTVYVLNNKIEEVNSSLKWYIDNGYLPDPSNVALVPIMTSNTTPYGEVITNSQYTNKYYAYKAFNDTISEPERWLSTNTTGQYIAYKFDKKANVKRLYLNCHNVYCVDQLFGAFKLQASNDGSTWSDIYSDDLSAYGEKNYSFGNENYYSYYRVLSTSSEAQYRSLSRVQFYGKFAS